MMRFAVPMGFAVVLASVSMASGAVLYSDNFESDAVGGPAAGWTSPAADTVLTVADDGTGNHVLDVNMTNTVNSSSRPLVVPLPSAVTLADGDSLQLSFDLRAITAPASIVVGDRQFRFALANSEGTSAITDDVGYIGRLDVGAPATTTFDLSGTNTGTVGLFSVSGSAKHSSSTNAAATLNDNITHTVTILLQRSGANITGSGTFTSGATTVTLASFSDTNASANLPSYTFDELAIGYNSVPSLEYTLDNVNVTSTVAAGAPEPASLGVLGAAGIGLLVRRRKM